MSDPLFTDTERQLATAAAEHAFIVAGDVTGEEMAREVLDAVGPAVVARVRDDMRRECNQKWIAQLSTLASSILAAGPTPTEETQQRKETTMNEQTLKGEPLVNEAVQREIAEAPTVEQAIRLAVEAGSGDRVNVDAVINWAVARVKELKAESWRATKRVQPRSAMIKHTLRCMDAAWRGKPCICPARAVQAAGLTPTEDEQSETCICTPDVCHGAEYHGGPVVCVPCYELDSEMSCLADTPTEET